MTDAIPEKSYSKKLKDTASILLTLDDNLALVEVAKIYFGGNLRNVPSMEDGAPRKGLNELQQLINGVHAIVRYVLPASLPELNEKKLKARTQASINSLRTLLHGVPTGELDALADDLEAALGKRATDICSALARSELGRKSATIPVFVSDNLQVVDGAPIPKKEKKLRVLNTEFEVQGISKGTLGLLLLVKSLIPDGLLQVEPEPISIFFQDIVGSGGINVSTSIDAGLTSSDALHPYYEAACEYCYKQIMQQVAKHGRALQMINAAGVVGGQEQEEISSILAEAGLASYPEKLDTPIECACVIESIRENLDNDVTLKRCIEQCCEITDNKRTMLDPGIIHTANAKLKAILEIAQDNSHLQAQIGLVHEFLGMEMKKSSGDWVGHATVSSNKMDGFKLS